jgi:hypothetical protein
MDGLAILFLQFRWVEFPFVAYASLGFLGLVIVGKHGFTSVCVLY